MMILRMPATTTTAPPSTTMAARDSAIVIPAMTAVKRSFGVVSATGLRGPFISGSGGMLAKAVPFPVSTSTRAVSVAGIFFGVRSSRSSSDASNTCVPKETVDRCRPDRRLLSLFTFQVGRQDTLQRGAICSEVERGRRKRFQLQYYVLRVRRKQIIIS
mmetsp:Transcript_18205/g.33827  ORF Transcript_18205/g.33827 Transcript_18205/m.33827 type:complete len:159 (+) Transcript_18205:697-1173(+)